MLTLFTMPKPFRGHIGVIQRNALQSWKALHPDLEVILFGGDEGTAEVCWEFGFRHEPNIAPNEFGAPRVDDIFQKGQSLGSNPFVCYINCDIALMSDFWAAFERVRHREGQFLMIGRRWDIDVTQPI